MATGPCKLLFTVLLAFAAIPLAAQEDPESVAVPEQAEADEESAPGTQAPDNADQGGGSPFDYEASEEISDDKPVSFPVDI